MMAFLLAAYTIDELPAKSGPLLRLHPRIAPYQVAVLPCRKRHPFAAFPGGPATPPTSGDVRLRRYAAIGRRYRRQDEIGTPLCVTVDFESLEDKAVTVRDRDSTTRSGYDRPARGDGHRTPRWLNTAALVPSGGLSLSSWVLSPKTSNGPGPPRTWLP